MLLHGTSTGQWNSTPAARGKCKEQLERLIMTRGSAVKYSFTLHGKGDRFPAWRRQRSHPQGADRAVVQGPVFGSASVIQGVFLCTGQGCQEESCFSIQVSRVEVEQA